MKCNDVLKQIFEGDTIENASFRVWLHLLFCKSCKIEVKKYHAVLNSLQDTSPYSLKSNTLKNDVMEQIFKTGKEYNYQISYFKWVSVGTIIIASRFLFSYSNSHKWLSNQFGTNFDLPLNIVLGTIISVYALVFIGSHTEDLKKISKYFTNKFS